MTEQELNELVGRWVTLVGNKPLEDEPGDINDEAQIAFMDVYDLVHHGAPSDAWTFILKAFEVANNAACLVHLAAGPLEDFLSRCGPEYIDEVEQRAAQSNRFERLVSGVWKFQMSDQVWDRILVIQRRAWTNRTHLDHPDPLL